MEREELRSQENKKERAVMYRGDEEKQINRDYRYAMDNLKEYLAVLQNYEKTKQNIEQLDRVNKSIKKTKDKEVIKKYQTTKTSLEKRICDTLAIEKDKPKFWQNEKMLEESFRNRVQKAVNELGEKAKIAKEKIEKVKAEEIKTKEQSHDVRSGINRNNVIEKSQTRARAR